MPSIVLTPLLFTPLIYLAGHWKAATAHRMTLAALGGIWFVFALAARDFASSNAPFLSFQQGMIAFYFDGISLFFTATVLLLTTLIAIYSEPDMRGAQGEEKYYAMLLMMTGAVIGLVCAGDLFNLWLWFELMAVSSYLLVAFDSERPDAIVACAKYLIQTATGSILVLFGMALVFAQTGTLDLVYTRAALNPMTGIAGAFFIIGFGVKIALVPTYTWLPDAYAQAPTGISAMLSGIVTITGLVALLRVLALLTGITFGWGAVLIGFGTVNMVVGNLLALRQDEVKRIFAYSSISHIGFMLLAVGIGLYSQQASGFYSGMLHLFTHALMKALAFLAVGVVIYTHLDSTVPLRLKHLWGLAERDPVTSTALVIACLSLAGIPPLAGFISKLQIFAAGLATGQPVLILLIAFAALNSVFSLAYYLPILNAVFQADSAPVQRAAPVAMHLPILLLTAAIIGLGLAPGLLNGLIEPASHALLRLFGG